LIDVEPSKLIPTWRNFRVGDAAIEKRLDHFIVSEHFFNGPLRLKSWVAAGGILDQSPIVFQSSSDELSPPSPFKFNPSWLLGEDIRTLISSN
jgi:hypothetical protein